MKAIILCLDGLEPSLAQDYPSLRLEYSGYSMAEDSKTPQAWVEFATGLESTQHGINNFRHPSGRPWCRYDIRRPSFWWNRLPCTVGVLDLPVVTNPAAPTAGWMVGGHTIYPPSKWPSNLPEIPPRYDAYEFPPEAAQLAWEKPPIEAWVARKVDICTSFAYYHCITTKQAVEQLLDARPVDVLIVYQHIADSIGHGFRAWHREVLDNTYYMLDGLARWLWETFRPEVRVVVSDHGMVPTGEDSLRRSVEPVSFLGEQTYLQRLWVKEKRLHVLCSGAHSDNPPGYLSSNIDFGHDLIRLRDLGDILVDVIGSRLDIPGSGQCQKDIERHLAALGYL